jgi:hypothetical protein
MKTIWKYPLEVTEFQDVKVPIGSKTLSVIMQKGTPTLYCLVNPEENRMESLTVRIIGTGHTHCDILGEFIGTITELNDRLVWHVFVG